MEAQDTHFPSGECTITLKDVALQLNLPLDGLVVTGSVVIPGRAQRRQRKIHLSIHPEDAKVPLIVYTMVEKHESDRVMQQTRLPVQSTCLDPESPTSHIYYWWTQGVGNFIKKGHDECPNNVGQKEVQ
ncbi:hypothetical protein Golob_024644 [Gossypium lobatum]|uniref:Uncharacterized protein n=1 Tax=Gossypium lobatum TaxID=34289 RepID=A0A7J8NLN8_9ROSI|nr:hypothetical protein [Gossypium lobatum]